MPAELEASILPHSCQVLMDDLHSSGVSELAFGPNDLALEILRRRNRLRSSGRMVDTVIHGWCHRDLVSLSRDTGLQ